MQTIKPTIHLNYPEKTMFQMIEDMAAAYPKAAAYEFYNKRTNYKTFVQNIETAARAFIAMGIRRNDAVTICLPNIPQALVCFYALNRIGAVSNMVHPLSARDEISFYLNFSKSKLILTVDMFYEKVEESLKEVNHPVKILVTRMQDELNPILSLAYTAKEGKKYLKYPNTDHAILWSRFLKKKEVRISHCQR